METPASSSRRVYAGLFEIDFGSGEVHKEGRKVQLQEQPFRVLAVLLEHAGEVVTRDQLQAKLWPADTYVGFDEGLNTAIRKLRVAFGDSAENPRFIETVSRRGYRFDSAGRAGTEAFAFSSCSNGCCQARTHFCPNPLDGISAVVVFAVCAMAVFLRTARHRKPPPGKIMLVVLPLENFSSDSQQNYLADGITEEIITQLGRLDPQHLGVIARTSAMHYKHAQKSAAPSLTRGRRRLPARGEHPHPPAFNRIRVTAQLIQSSDQTHLWAHSYDRELSDVLRIESDIASSVASEIRLTLSQQVHQRLAAPGRTNVEAHDAYLRGLQGWNLRTRDGFQQAHHEFHPSHRTRSWRSARLCRSCARLLAGPDFRGHARRRGGPPKPWRLPVEPSASTRRWPMLIALWDLSKRTTNTTGRQRSVSFVGRSNSNRTMRMPTCFTPTATFHRSAATKKPSRR